MKYIQLFESYNRNSHELTEEQITFLDKYTRGRWGINYYTGLVDIKGDFICGSQGLKNFKGVEFGTVTGTFDSSNNQLTDLRGAPQKVGGDFYCNMNQLTSLVGAPQEVGIGFYYGANPLKSLEGAPGKIGYNIDKQITSQIRNTGWPLLGVHQYYHYTGPIKGSDIIKNGFQEMVEKNAFLRAWFDDYGRSFDKEDPDYDIYDDDFFWGHTDENIYGIKDILKNDGIDDITLMDLYSIIFAEILNSILYIDPLFKKDFDAEDEQSAISQGVEDLTFLIDYPIIIAGIKKAREKSIENIISKGHSNWEGLGIDDIKELKSHPDFPPFKGWFPATSGMDIARKRSGYT